MEIWKCRKCGGEVAVHCNYVPDLAGMPPLHDRFVGTVSVELEAEALKTLLKLKKVLSFAERFVPSKLEDQHRDGKLTWDLGEFFDFEVERATAECLQSGVEVRFKRVET